MPVLDRQSVAAPPRRVIDRVDETAPTPLQRQYINLSAIALVAGFLAITALETGSTFSSPLVKICALIGGPIIVITTGDAVLRFWRSAIAWMPVNRNRALFRVTWVLAGVLGMLVFGTATVAILLA
jgi:hypothetical protein